LPKNIRFVILDNGGFVNLTTVVLIGLLFVALTAVLARRKHRNVWLWGLNGFCGVIGALIALAFFGDLEKMTPEEAKRSRFKEKIVSAILIFLGLLRFVVQPRAMP